MANETKDRIEVEMNQNLSTERLLSTLATNEDRTATVGNVTWGEGGPARGL